jgi:hypothetical protein
MEEKIFEDKEGLFYFDKLLKLKIKEFGESSLEVAETYVNWGKLEVKNKNY